MGNQALIPERFFAELDRLGTAVVRQRLTAGAWGKAGQKAKLARQWLADGARRATPAPSPKPPSAPLPAVAAIKREVLRAAPDAFPGPHDAVRRSAAAAEESADLAESAYAIARDANFRAALAMAIAAASLLVHLMLVFVRPS